LAFCCFCSWRAASGPYGLLFSCFVPFALEVPPLHRFTLFGLRLTDKVAAAPFLVSPMPGCGPHGCKKLLSDVKCVAWNYQ